MSGAARRDPEVLLPGCGLTSPDELVATFAWTTAWRATCGRGAGTAGLRGQRERLGPLLSRLPTRISTLDRRFYGDAGPDPDGQIESAGFWHRTGTSVHRARVRLLGRVRVEEIVVAPNLVL